VAYTLADLRGYGAQHGWTDVSAEGIVAFDAWANDMIQRLASARNWPSYRKSYYLGLTAPYSTGTVTTTNDPTLTGDSTTWVAGMAGQEFFDAADSVRVYQIAEFTTITALELTQSYIGTEAAGQSYEIRYVRLAMPPDFDRPSGAMYDQSGRELTFQRVSLGEWHALRMMNRGKTSIPTHIAWDSGGPGQASSKYAYVHPAPSAARIIRGTYQATPVTATASVDPDWPLKFRYLLHKLLRKEVAVADGGGGGTLETEEFQLLLDEAYQRDVQTSGPFEIKQGARASALVQADIFKSQINIAE